MWIKTKSGRCYNLDRADGLILKRNRDREVGLYVMIHEKGYALGYYQSVKKAQSAMNDIVDEMTDGCELYEMDGGE